MKQTNEKRVTLALAMAHSARIETRLEAILNATQPRRPLPPYQTALTLLGACSLLIPLAAARVGAKPSAPVAQAAPAYESRVAAEVAFPTTHPDLLGTDAVAHTALDPMRTPGEIALETHAALNSADPSAPAEAEPAEILWGEPHDGLQAGLRREGKSARFTVGERVPLSAYLRNVSNHDIAFVYATNAFDDKPEVEDAHGNRHPVLDVIRLGLPSAIGLLLKRGETLIAPYVGLVIGNITHAGQNPFPYFEKPEPGIYTIRQSFRYRILTPADFHDLQQRFASKKWLLYPYDTTLLTRDGKTKAGHSILTGADSYGLAQRQSPEEGLWTGKVTLEDRAFLRDPRFDDDLLLVDVEINDAIDQMEVFELH